MRIWWAIALSAVSVLALAACTSGTSSGSGPASSAAGARSGGASSSHGVNAQALASGGGHVVVVMMENHSYADIIGSSQAPYLNSLARRGKSLTRMYAITHPSQPNYVALIAGGPHGVTGDSCPQRLSGATLASELRASHRGFVGYSEGLPYTGSRVCAAGAYVRRHNPWSDFANLPSWVNKPMSAFPTDYAELPTLSFVVPNLNHDMHDGTIRQADTWLHQHLARYATWASAHGSLLVITWDEDDHSASNRIPTVIVGAGVRPGRIGTHLTLYSLLRLLEDRYHLHRLGASANAAAIPLG